MFRPLSSKLLPLERMFPQVAQALLFLCQLRQLGPIALRQGKLCLGRLAFGLRFCQTLLRRRMRLPFCEQLLLRRLMRCEIGVYPRSTAGLGQTAAIRFHFFLFLLQCLALGLLLLQGSKALRKCLCRPQSCIFVLECLFRGLLRRLRLNQLFAQGGLLLFKEWKGLYPFPFQNGALCRLELARLFAKRGGHLLQIARRTLPAPRCKERLEHLRFIARTGQEQL